MKLNVFNLTIGILNFLVFLVYHNLLNLIIGGMCLYIGIYSYIKEKD